MPNPKSAAPKRTRRSSVLTEKQDTYVQNRLDGKSKKEAATAAGFSNVTAYPTVLERSNDVAEALAKAREELSDAAQIKRADVVQMLTEAYDMAKLAAEPASMVAAAREIGKMLGLYAPEVKEINLTTGQARMQQKFQALGDNELLEIAEGRAVVVEGEFKRLS